MNLLEQLRMLVELQYLFDRKAELLRSREQTPENLAQLEQEFTQFEGECLQKKAEHENARKLRRSLEGEVKELENRRQRSTGRSNEVKTNREFRAILKEIEDLKVEIVVKEDQVLECMEVIERLDKEVKELEGELEKRRKQLHQDKEALQQESGQVEVRVVRLEALEQEVRAKIDPDILKRFDFLMEKRGWCAVAGVRGGVCQSCRLNIPPQKFIELQRDETLHHCPSCHRFIYWADSESYQVFAEDLAAL
jgi:hypothetical protein